MLEKKHFQRIREDFTCEHCGFEVVGDKFANHCPQCLWSKHTDTSSGNLGELCNGMMEPIAVEVEKGEFRLINKCQECAVVKRNRLGLHDNFEAAGALAKKKGDIMLGKK
jgi:hypothetical protein